MHRLLLLLALLTSFLPPALAQERRIKFSAEQVQQFEDALAINPGDMVARRVLLEYYFYNSALPRAEVLPARRRHILWLIENAPGGELAGTPAATIDASRNRLADRDGFKQASDAWRAQTAKPNASAMVLANAARFFKLSDKAFTMTLLERALAAEPSNKEIGARLGDVYALAIMGVTMVNANGYPTAADPNLTQSAAALQARAALGTSGNPYALAKAGYMLSWQGAILYYSQKIPFDPASMAEAALQRAVGLAPGDGEVRSLLDAHYEIQRQRPVASTVPQTPAPVAAPAPVTIPVPAVTAEELRKASVGMTRDELLQLGKPTGRLTLSDDGHLMETYQYVRDGKRIGTVRLQDGLVSRVEIP